MQVSLIFALLVAALAIVFALQNGIPTTITFMTWTFQGSLALILLIALGVGALISLLVFLPAWVRDKWTISAQKKKLTELEARLSPEKGKLEPADRR
jgi:uncharacterized integral membrane protein